VDVDDVELLAPAQAPDRESAADEIAGRGQLVAQPLLDAVDRGFVVGQVFPALREVAEPDDPDAGDGLVAEPLVGRGEHRHVDATLLQEPDGPDQPGRDYVGF
jgi:hypothetical protein